MRRAPVMARVVGSVWGAGPLALLLCLLAACGTASSPSHPPSKVTLSEQLVREHAGVLTLRQPGLAPLRVHFSATRTPIYAVTRGARIDIQPGSCLSVTGRQDATGAVTATSAIVSTSVDDDCPDVDLAPTTLLPPVPSATPSATASDPPSPGTSPSPRTSPSPPSEVATEQGQVLADGGPAVTILRTDGHVGVVLVPVGTPVQDFAAAYPSALLVPSCLTVFGWTAGRRTVSATKLIDAPSGPNSPCP